MNPVNKYQMYQCPEEFQQRINEVGGFNRYDQPNFLIRWAQGGEEECLFRSGGTWAVEGQPSFTGYRDLLVGGGTPSWMLLQWQDALEYGTPELFYMQNLDPATKMQNLGEYPYNGRYKMLYNLRWAEKRNGKMHFEAMPLNALLINTIIPIIKDAKDISWETTKASMQELERKAYKKDLGQIEDRMRSNALPFHGAAVSYGRQGCRTSLVDKKIESMQRNWNKMMTRATSLGKGLSTRGTSHV